MTTTCEHPDHVEGETCEERAVGCGITCPCCVVPWPTETAVPAATETEETAARAAARLETTAWRCIYTLGPRGSKSRVAVRFGATLGGVRSTLHGILPEGARVLSVLPLAAP